MVQVIGGEFDFLNRVAGEKHNSLFDDCVLYSSGRAAWWQILNSLKNQGNVHHVLLPDYLCDSVYHVCDALQIPYSFYPIRADLSVDRTQLGCLYNAVGGGYYFGCKLFRDDRCRG